METLKNNEYKMIKIYRKTKDENIALYFYEKFKFDVSEIIFSKINRKFSSVPFEKGDLFHLVWNGIQKTLKEYRKSNNFNAVLIQNCYYLTIQEIRKFLNNNELVMNVSTSLENINSQPWRKVGEGGITRFELPDKIVLQNLIQSACHYVKKYSQPTIKRVIFLKSQGYSVAEISRKLRISKYYINDLLKSIEKMVKKIYF